MYAEQESTFVRHEPCPECGSKDNLARYSDGHAVCFSGGCSHYEHPTGEVIEFKRKVESKPLAEQTGVTAAIVDRRITQDTCKKFGVTVEYGTDGHIIKHHYPYFDKSTMELRGSKTRIVDNKQFYAQGSFDNVGLFGQQAFKEGGKYITITEGEMDALAVSEMFDGKWPVVSIRSGAAGAAKDIKANLEWLETFENIVLCFDNDKAGQEAARACLSLFSPNKAKNVQLSLKDAGEMLREGKIKQFVQEWWNAKTYRPDGIVAGIDTWDMVVEQENIVSIPYPWQCLNELTHGFRAKELVTITSGSGMGKSQMVRELQYYLLNATKDNIGILALEEDVPKTTLGIMSLEAEQPLHLDKTISREEKRKYWEKTLGTGRFFLLDHWGSAQEDDLLSKVRYMAKGLDCKWIVLDHLSIVVSDQEHGDERKAIDSIMTKLRSLVQETGVGLFLVSHLRRPSGGKGHEEGAQVSLADLRGSAAIAQLSDMVIGLERNQQHKDEEVRNTTTVRVLKNRFAGLTGPACYLYYDKDSGRMIETSCPIDDDTESEF
jgi:twinkle protein